VGHSKSPFNKSCDLEATGLEVKNIVKKGGGLRKGQARPEKVHRELDPEGMICAEFH